MLPKEWLVRIKEGTRGPTIPSMHLSLKHMNKVGTGTEKEKIRETNQNSP